MKKLLTNNANEKVIIIRKNILIEPTLDSLQEQRNFHITQLELHQCELTLLDAKIRSLKQISEGETIVDFQNSPLRLKSGGSFF